LLESDAARATQPPRLLLITDRRCVPAGRTLPEQIARALVGAPAEVAVLLRDKDAEDIERRRLAEDLRTVTADANVRLLIHGDLILADAVGADGVHVADDAAARARLADADPTWLRGASCHGAASLADAAQVAHYATLSPILASPGKGAPLGLDALDGHPLPVLALGGIGPSAAGDAVRAGAWGVAGIRAYLAAADPAGAVRSTLEAMRA